ncbi:glycosyltransferase [Weissella confusa]|nr:glycosyltransferase [Weissella confusa]
MLTQLPVIWQVILTILCLYPIIGALFWFCGTVSYQLLHPRHVDEKWDQLPVTEQPFITIMIPAHNEEVMIADTIKYLMTRMNYTRYEVLVMDDGSTDETPEILNTLQSQYQNLRVIRVVDNQGKAHAFNIGLHFAKGEYILSNDADTLPEPDALMKYMNYFIHETDMNTAAVTANMDVQNRSTLLGKSQTVEFSSIVGVIKRSQAAINESMYAYSGANTMYRKSFLISVGGFRQDRATEDISIAWDHQMAGMVPRFAPNIVFHMNVPETIGDLYKQRKRWAQGGTEVWLTNLPQFLKHPWKHRYVATMFVDSTLSIVWSLFWVISTILLAGKLVIAAMTQNWQSMQQVFLMAMVFITFELLAGFLQIGAALVVDQSAAKLKYLLFAPFYMLFFWMINPITVVVTLVPAIKTIMGFGTGTWVSPKRQNLNTN